MESRNVRRGSRAGRTLSTLFALALVMGLWPAASALAATGADPAGGAAEVAGGIAEAPAARPGAPDARPGEADGPGAGAAADKPLAAADEPPAADEGSDRGDPEPAARALAAEDELDAEGKLESGGATQTAVAANANANAAADAGAAVEAEDEAAAEGALVAAADAAEVNEVRTAEELQAAVTSHAPSIKLMADIDISPLDGGSGDLDIRYEVTLDLNGHKLSSTGESYGTIYVGEGAALTIADSSEGRTGKVTNPSWVIYVDENATLAVQGGELSGNAGIACWGSTTIGDTAKVACRSNAIQVLAGTVAVNGGEVSSTQSDAIAVFGGTLNVSGGTVTGAFSGISVPSYDGYAVEGVNIGGGTIQGGSGYGQYAIDVNTEAVLALSDAAKIMGRNGLSLRSDKATATMSGGSIGVDKVGVYVWKGSFTLSGGGIAADGAGVHVGNGEYANGVNAAFTMTGGSIDAGSYGVDVTADSRATVSGGKIEATDGFGLLVCHYSEVTVLGGSIKGANMFETSENGRLYIKGGEWTGDFIAQNRYPEITGGVFASRTGKMVHVNDEGRPETAHYLEEYVADGYALVDLDDNVDEDDGTYSFGVGKADPPSLSIDPEETTKYFDGTGVKLVAQPGIGTVAANGNEYDAAFPDDSVLTTFQWSREGEAIPDATRSTYVTSGDVCGETPYTCTVTFANEVNNRVKADADRWEAASATAKVTILRLFTVAFASAGGSAVESQGVAGGDVAREPEAPTREGYVFAGWLAADGEPYDFSTPVMGDITLVAKWEAAPAPDPAPAPAPAPGPSDGGEAAPAGGEAAGPAAGSTATTATTVTTVASTRTAGEPAKDAKDAEPAGKPASPETGDLPAGVMLALAVLAAAAGGVLGVAGRRRRRGAEGAPAAGGR